MSKSQKSKSWVYGLCAGLASLAVLAAPALSDVTDSLNGGGVSSGPSSEKCIVIESKFGANFTDGTACSNISIAGANGELGKQLTFKELLELPAGSQLIICSDQIKGWGFMATTPLKDSPPYTMVNLAQCVK